MYYSQIGQKIIYSFCIALFNSVIIKFYVKNTYLHPFSASANTSLFKASTRSSWRALKNHLHSDYLNICTLYFSIAIPNFLNTKLSIYRVATNPYIPQ